MVLVFVANSEFPDTIKYEKITAKYNKDKPINAGKLSKLKSIRDKLNSESLNNMSPVSYIYDAIYGEPLQLDRFFINLRWIN